MPDDKLYNTMLGPKPMAECRRCARLSILAAIDPSNGLCLGCSEGWNVSVPAAADLPVQGEPQ